MSRTVIPSFLILAIAAVCHEVNRAICVAFGDLSQKSWDAAEQWQRDSAIKGVEFAIANPDAPPSAQHDAWMADKIADGWVYGETKDPIAKTHPCMVPYDQLPPEQRVKDHTFRAVVATMAGQAQSDAPHGTDRMMQFFGFAHLPEHLQAHSKPFHDLAQAIVDTLPAIVDTLPANAERTTALRKLLEAKDCAVRARIYKEPERTA